MQKSPLNLTVAVLLIVGGLNWGSVALLNLNLVEAVLGSIPIAAQAVYILIALAALYKLAKLIGVMK